MNLLQILGINQSLLPNLCGNHLKVILIWKAFLNQVESDLFKVIEKPLGYSNLWKEESNAIRSLADDKSIVIKRADKGSCAVIWDRKNYVKKAEIKLSDQNVYKSVEFKDKILSKLVEKTIMFLNL